MHLQTHWPVQGLPSKKMNYMDQYPKMRVFYNVMNCAPIHTADGLIKRVVEASNEIESSTFMNIY